MTECAKRVKPKVLPVQPGVKAVVFAPVRVDVVSEATDMEASETIQCPYCGQSFDLVIDTSPQTQRFTTDCEVCCRPFEVFVECEPGEVLNLEVHGA